MLPSKTKSGLFEATSNKTTPATPRASKLGRTGSTKSDPASPYPLQNSRMSVDRSPKSVDSKPPERRTPKIVTTPDKPSRVAKSSDMQEQLNVLQEDLKKANENLASVEKEKTCALEELKNANKLADEANEKLQKALAAQKRAEESSEIEKFRADELEQAGIEAAQKREEEWQNELETAHNQHTVDVDALLSITQELQRAKHELSMTIDAKNSALTHADDAMKIAEINAEKVELLSNEVSRLKLLLDSKLESKNAEAAELVEKLESEVVALKLEIEKAKAAEDKLVEMEELIEGLKVEVNDMKKAEYDAASMLDEWKKKALLLEAQLEEANMSEKSSLDSLATARKQLEESRTSLQDAESEIAKLEEKMGSLEIELGRHKEDLDDSNRRFEVAQQEALEMGKMVDLLKSELQKVEEAKMIALSNEAAAALQIESLSAEKKKLVDELEITRDDGEKAKTAMEGLASALHEVSLEVRGTQERLSTKEAEVEDAHAQIEELSLSLKSTKESYEVMLNEARDEIIYLKESIERSETEAKSSQNEWDGKELNFLNAIRTSEEEIAVIKAEMGKMADSLKEAERETNAANEDGVKLLNELRLAESASTAAGDALAEAKAESLLLKERLLDKENALQSIIQENDDLRIREAGVQERLKELTALLAEATAKKSEENGDLSNSEKEYDLAHKAIEAPMEDSIENKTEKPNVDESMKHKDEENAKEGMKLKEENGNGNAEEEEALKEEAKMWESCKMAEKDLSAETENEAESVDNDSDSKMDSTSCDQMNGLSSENAENGTISPTKQPLQQKKKKALLQKFGSLLKKKSNHK